jgi:hypothetical protein
MPDPYRIIPPRIPSGNTYLFTTDSGMEYEVRFARKKHDLLSATVAFGVTNEEFEGEEYVATNKGELYRVMATVVEVVKMYLKEHPHIRTLEFSGEPTEEEDDRSNTTRIRLYQRYLGKIFDENWEPTMENNRIVMRKIRKGE